MISLSLSDDQAGLLEYALNRARRIELADAAACPRHEVRDSHIVRARQIEELRTALDYALPELDHR